MIEKRKRGNQIMYRKLFPLILMFICAALSAMEFKLGSFISGGVMLVFVGINFWSYKLYCKLEDGKEDDESL